jgi:glyoxylase-like metal-dependent hydrolase (beta-lactamase superfamily II)
MKEVYSGIFLIEEKGRFGPSDNIYVLAGNDGLIYDAGYGYKKALKNFFKEFKEIQNYYENQMKKFRITRITVSHGHSDHFSGLNSISNTLGLKVILTEKIANTIKDRISFEINFRGDDYEDFLRVRNKLIHKIWKFLRLLGTRLFFRGIHGLSYSDHPDEIIDENFIVLLNGEPWIIFPSPGHSPEHISLYNEEKGILFSGDNVLKMRSTWLGPPESNITDYIETIKKLQNLPKLKLILPAHGEIIENPKDTLSAILQRMEQREKQILQAINKNLEKGLSADDIVKLIYPDSNKFTRIIARDWVVLTLKLLESQKILKREIVKKKILFFIV